VGQGLAGVVHEIFPSAFTKISSLGVEQQRVLVIIQFAPQVGEPWSQQLPLGAAYRVRVRIFTARQNNALIVPRTALFRSREGDWQVFVIRAGRARLQSVEVGLMTDLQAEIRRGLQDQERVVLAPETDLVEGARVRTVQVPRPLARAQP
jgi:HlyD family secretion protein